MAAFLLWKGKAQSGRNRRAIKKYLRIDKNHAIMRQMPVLGRKGRTLVTGIPTAGKRAEKR